VDSDGAVGGAGAVNVVDVFNVVGLAGMQIIVEMMERLGFGFGSGFFIKPLGIRALFDTACGLYSKSPSSFQKQKAVIQPE